MFIPNVPEVDTSNVPGHIPSELVVPYDLLRVSTQYEDPFRVLAGFRDRPRVFYTPVHFSSNRGAWVLTRAADIRSVLQTPGLFSSNGVSGFSKLLGEEWSLIPLELDPPSHDKFRILLNPLFAPNRIAKLQEGIRNSCVELIEKISSEGHCDFIEAFARQFPVKVFLQLMGLPLDQFDLFMKWEGDLLHSPDIEVRITAGKAIRDYLRALIADRRVTPQDDLTSFAVHAKIDGQPISDDEILGICYLLFVGGLDTVTSSLGFHFKYLAEHPEEQTKLRDNPGLIPDAVEELLRANAVVMVSRFLKSDAEVAGVQMKAGDCIAVYTAFAGLDASETESPETVDFARSDKRHITFSYGPHRCIGSHLARRELSIALEEWTRRVPGFRILPEGEVTMHGGVVFGVDTLPLVWDAA